MTHIEVSDAMQEAVVAVVKARLNYTVLMNREGAELLAARTAAAKALVELGELTYKAILAVGAPTEAPDA